MLTAIANSDLYFARPWWLLGLVLLLPMLRLAWKHLLVIHPVRRFLILMLRCLSMMLLILMLAQVMFEKEAKTLMASEFPTHLSRLMEVDAILLANVNCRILTDEQQKMINRYVTELGGGLIMAGGPTSFCAGGWIGSPVAEVLPVGLNPSPPKTKRALVLIIDNYDQGKQAAAAAAEALNQHDLLGVLAYNRHGSNEWGFPLKETEDKMELVAAIQQTKMDNLPSLTDTLQRAYDALMAADAEQKHVIVISDGTSAQPPRQLLDTIKTEGIICTGIAVNSHSRRNTESLTRVAQRTGGRFYKLKSPQLLPQIIIKEIPIRGRSPIVEQTFVPQIMSSSSEILKGLPQTLPTLDGYVRTSPKGGLDHLVLSGPEGDPIMATCQAGLGRCAAFTSSMDSRWAASWTTGPVMERFVGQIVRWVRKPASGSEYELKVDIEGRLVNLQMESVDREGQFQLLGHLKCHVILPNMDSETLTLTQAESRQYRGRLKGDQEGIYIITLQNQPANSDASKMMQWAVSLPFTSEFRELSENTSLLTSVSDITGGRILPNDPNRANVFDHAGVHFPRIQLPLLPHLPMLWLAVFLLDIAAYVVTTIRTRPRSQTSEMS